VELHNAASPTDGPQKYEVKGSSDGKQWKSLSKGEGNGGFTDISFDPTSVRYLRILQLGSKPNKFWSIHELELLTPPK
jgi:F5/8 type C domain